jgi:hypothetical protein
MNEIRFGDWLKKADKKTVVYIGGKWYEATPRELLVHAPPGAMIWVPSSTGLLSTVYRPPRRRGESPIDYYKRTGCVDDRFARKHRGWYYCNPAHCQSHWKDKTKRDEHLSRAYGALM